MYSSLVIVGALILIFLANYLVHRLRTHRGHYFKQHRWNSNRIVVVRQKRFTKSCTLCLVDRCFHTIDTVVDELPLPDTEQ